MPESAPPPFYVGDAGGHDGSDGVRPDIEGICPTAFAAVVACGVSHRSFKRPKMTG
jgi:hypothetical protein